MSEVNFYDGNTTLHLLLITGIAPSMWRSRFSFAADYVYVFVIPVNKFEHFFQNSAVMIFVAVLQNVYTRKFVLKEMSWRERKQLCCIAKVSSTMWKECDLRFVRNKIKLETVETIADSTLKMKQNNM